MIGTAAVCFYVFVSRYVASLFQAFRSWGLPGLRVPLHWYPNTWNRLYYLPCVAGDARGEGGAVACENIRSPRSSPLRAKRPQRRRARRNGCFRRLGARKPLKIVFTRFLRVRKIPIGNEAPEGIRVRFRRENCQSKKALA